MTVRPTLEGTDDPYHRNEVDAAERRIAAAVAAGVKPNMADFLIVGTRFDKIEEWFKDAYKDLP